ncbi:class I SAM-dependent methyltransferase [bacterium]|jgi:ubiquinone/menaquinone biosynthesis C-methylase UbiE|nr:class I SAM-dependent methyltransferase [bacterium]
MSLFRLFLRALPERIVAKQLKKPSGLLGLAFGRMMSKGNAGINELVLDGLDLTLRDHVLEVGFGHGALIEDIAKQVPNGQIFGLDYSKTMVKQAISRNRRSIKQGRVRLVTGDISRLPYEDQTMTKIATVNTLYFWPDVTKGMSELARIAKPGARLVIGIRDKTEMDQIPFTKHEFTTISVDDVKKLLTQHGWINIRSEYSDVDMMGSYAVIGERPE